MLVAPRFSEIERKPKCRSRLYGLFSLPPPDDKGALTRHFFAQERKPIVFKPGNSEPEAAPSMTNADKRDHTPPDVPPGKSVPPPKEHPEERTVESGGMGSPSVTQQVGTGGGFGGGFARGAGRAAGSSSALAEGTGTREITQQTVTFVIQNRAAIGGQTSLLLKLLDGLDGLDDDPQRRRNYSLRDTLGLTSEINEGELITLLRELRDELRQFREALESASVEPTTLEQLRDIGLGNLKALSTNKVFVSMQGAALGGMLWTLLVNVGAIDVPLAKEILGLILD